MSSPLAAAGRTQVHDDAVAALGGGLALARVALVHGASLELVTESGTRPGHPTGRLRHGAASPADLPAVGDWVGYDAESGAVHAVLERRSALVRADNWLTIRCCSWMSSRVRPGGIEPATMASTSPREMQFNRRPSTVRRRGSPGDESA